MRLQVFSHIFEGFQISKKKQNYKSTFFSLLNFRETLSNSKLDITNPIILHSIIRIRNPIVSYSSIYCMLANFLRALSPLNGSPLKLVIINSRKIQYRCEAPLRILEWKTTWKKRKKGYSANSNETIAFYYRYFDIYLIVTTKGHNRD